MLDLCPDTLAWKRDRTLMALGFAGASRRSELVARDVTDPAETPDGTDQEGKGAEVVILRDAAALGRQRCSATAD